MDRARILAEPDLLTWLADAPPKLVEAVGREVAVRVALRFCENRQGWDDWYWRDKLGADPSPLVRLIAGQAHKPWEVPYIVGLVMAALDLHGGERDIEDRVRARVKR